MIPRAWVVSRNQLLLFPPPALSHRLGLDRFQEWEFMRAGICKRSFLDWPQRGVTLIHHAPMKNLSVRAQVRAFV
jgi:hypothetical protein